MSTTAPAAEPLWMKNARQLVGLKEIVGSKHEPKVLEFFAEAGHPEIHNDETAWCAAFANAMLRRAGYAGTGSLAARSFLTWGETLKTPRPGCIVVFKRGNSTWEGHVAFFVREVGDSIEVLGGNQGNAVSIARMSKASLLGYRWPLIATAPAAKPKPAPVKEAVKAAAGVGAGAGAAKVAKDGLDAGWGAFEWSLFVGAIVLAVVAGYFAYRFLWPRVVEWWQRDPAYHDKLLDGEPSMASKPLLPPAEDMWKPAAAKPATVKRRAPRKPAAKPRAKKKAAKKPAKRKAA